MPLTEKQKQHRKARRLWVKALESGKFRHTTGLLQGQNNTFCCLGVACVVAEKEGVEVRQIKNQITGITLANQPRVKDWLGLSDGAAEYIDGSLVDLNDNAKRNPFKKIAKIIASEPEGLFVD